MRYFNIIILLVFISSAASAQVDTLQLVEIGSIQAPSAITGLYVEDLDGDSLKEIILCTDSYVYIYNSQTYQVEWTSPPLNHPADLLFEDINRDGFIDFSVKDSTNIHLFDPHTPQAIWTSPDLDSTYKCYTIGDRNDDDWVDVAIVTKETFTRAGSYDNMDTAWIDVYNGPDLQFADEFITLLNNYDYYEPEYGEEKLEWPTEIQFTKLSYQSSVEHVFVIISYSEMHGHYHGGSYVSIYSGGISILDQMNPGDYIYSSMGEIKYSSKFIAGSDHYYNIIGYRNLWWSGNSDYGREFGVKHGMFSADSLIDSTTVFYDEWDSMGNPREHWRNFLIGRFEAGNNNLYLCYGVNDSLYLLSYPQMNYMWQIGDIAWPFWINGLYFSEAIYNNPLIVVDCWNTSTYKFFSGIDGSLIAIFPNPQFAINNIFDLDGNGNDEILSIQGNSLFIYDLDYATGIGNETNLPILAFLCPNFPNPFNSSTTIEYGMPEARRVRIDIYDLLGRRVETLVDKELPAGRHRAVWDASNYSSGVYFYRIESGDFMDTKRMMYLK